MATKFPRKFEFGRDTFAFANELVWEYEFDAAGKMTTRPRVPRPDYAHHCFVLTRAARQFLYHAEFRPDETSVDDDRYRALVRQVLAGNPRVPDGKRVVIPGYPDLHHFSVAKERLLKGGCGGAWRSYVLRSHWRMLFPISRAHQDWTARQMLAEVREHFSPIVHLVNFPSLNINHGMIVYDATEESGGIHFSAYDPNRPAAPARLTFDRARRTFSLPPNIYWAGGDLNVIEIFRNWIL